MFMLFQAYSVREANQKDFQEYDIHERTCYEQKTKRFTFWF